MIPAASTSSSVRTLVDYWNEARLRAELAKSGSVRQAPGLVPWRSALEDVLKVGYGMQDQPRFADGGWERIRWRTTPSAGALYPFDVVATVVGEGSYLWDVESSRLLSCGVPPLTQDSLARAGLVTRPGHRLDTLLTFVARPWKSMKKYHLRGYAYTHLDVGHTAVNLGLYTTALGHNPTVHLRFSRQFFVEHLNLAGLCREPLAVVSFASPPSVAIAQLAAGVGETGPQRLGWERPGPQETLTWESLRGFLSFDCPLVPPCDPASSTLVAEPAHAPASRFLPLPTSHPRPSSSSEWRSAILDRRSAKGFYKRPLSVAQIGELLAALRTEGLPEDCSRGVCSQLGVRLVARNVEGLSGVFAYSPEHHALHRIDERIDDHMPACMQQGIAANAAALLILHAPYCRLIDSHGYSAFAELHFHAAELGQALHLAATRLTGVGMTCIGGFDGEHCARLVRLETGEEPIYVILLGMRNDAAFKHDRLKVAFSHGHTGTLED